VIQRGIDRAACFFRDEDCRVYLDTLAGLARSCGVSIHAYVLMTNHVHLLVTAFAQPNLPALMKGLGLRR
jgi:putative transposase